MNTPLRKTPWFTRHTLLLRTGLSVLAIGGSEALLQAQTPAARLRLAQPIQVSPVISRGGTPDTTPMALMPTPARPASDSITDRFGRLFLAPTPASAPPATSTPLFGDLPSGGGGIVSTRLSPGSEAGIRSPFSRGWEEFRALLRGSPAMPPSAAAPASTAAPEPALANPERSSQGPNGYAPSHTSMIPASAEVALPTPTVYASPPAYRWYGWGTTTPGANPYAPAGKSPQASASWYSQSRATPGAFPVPAELPMSVTAPRNEPPAYAADHSSTREEPRVRSVGGVTGSANRGISSAPTERPLSAPGPVSTSQPPMLGSPPTMTAPPRLQWPGVRPSPLASSTPLAPSAPVPAVKTATPTNSGGLTWKAVPGAVAPKPEVGPVHSPTPVPPPRIVLEREAKSEPAEPAPLPPTVVLPAEQLRSLILTACQEWVSDVQVIPTGHGKIQVTFAAYSESHAHAAAEAVSQLPEFRGYEIGFEARISKR